MSRWAPNGNVTPLTMGWNCGIKLWDGTVGLNCGIELLDGVCGM